MNNLIEVFVSDDISIQCSTHKEVCPCCQGEGRQLIGAFRGQAIEPELMHDEEFMAMYNGGSFDENCSECKGLRVVDAPSIPEEYEEQHKQYQAELDRYERECEAEYAAERAMGA